MSAGSKKKPSSFLQRNNGGSFSYGGNTLSSSNYDQKTGRYNQSVTLSPMEQGLRTQGLSGMRDGLNGVQNASNWSDGRRSQVADSIFNPQAREINTSYDNETDEAVNRFSAMGGANSAGFGNYMTQNIGKNRANSLGDARFKSNLATYDVQGKDLANAIEGLSANQTAVNNIDNTALGFLNPAFQGAQQGLGFAQALDQASKRQKGFLSSIF